MDQVIAALRRDVDEQDEMLRGDGNGKAGLVARVRQLELRDQEVARMLKEWEAAKAQLKGARAAVIAVGIIVSLLGGGLGIAILETLRRLAAEMP